MLGSNNKSVFEILGRHPIHPFPARMAPGIALDAIGASSPPLKVLDPMAGSGTVLAVARAKGHRAIGVDLDPLAVLLAGVWTRRVEPDEVKEKAMEVLDRAKRRSAAMAARDAYPPCDVETRQFLRFWFDQEARRQLTSLSDAIRRVHDRSIRDSLWCGFSRLIITKRGGASRAMDLSHSRPHRTYEHAQIEPFEKFLSAVNTVVSNCPQRRDGPIGPAAKVCRGDARKLSLAAGSIDLVLTSPPYLNAIDYLRCSKFTLVWMGHTIRSLRQLRGQSVGMRPSDKEVCEIDWVRSLLKELRVDSCLTNRDRSMLATYAWDMNLAMTEVSRVLKSKGRAVFVVGDTKIRGAYIRNSRIVEVLAAINGLDQVKKHYRRLPPNRRYLPPPVRQAEPNQLDGRMNREVVIEFRKVEKSS